jgi:hypothetical protein
VFKGLKFDAEDALVHRTLLGEAALKILQETRKIKINHTKLDRR